jgi:hypothetical protein
VAPSELFAHGLKARPTVVFSHPSHTDADPLLLLLAAAVAAAAAAAILQLSSASAAVSSFDDVCEAFGDIAKLDGLVARGTSAAAAVLAPVPGAPIGLDVSVGLR